MSEEEKVVLSKAMSLFRAYSFGMWTKVAEAGGIPSSHVDMHVEADARRQEALLSERIEDRRI